MQQLAGELTSKDAEKIRKTMKKLNEISNIVGAGRLQ